MDKVDITIIGAGVVGLGIAARMSNSNRTCIVLEKNSSFGQETSSRNSEVIHSGIYYPKDSLKAKLCVRGNALLYEHCAKSGIKHEKTGKIIVASDNEEVEKIEQLKENGTNNGVQGLELLTSRQVRQMEPDIDAKAGLLSPSTGIIDTHTLMQKYASQVQGHGSMIAYDSEVTAIEKLHDGFKVTIQKDNYQFETEVLINCAGLNSDKIASLCGIDIDKANYKLYLCKGNYFRTQQKFNVKKLIYPVPSISIAHLGIHLTLDLAGSIRFGPDAHYVDTIDYTIDQDQRSAFYNSIKKYLPSISDDSLYPDTSGVRPKLQGPDDGFRDFVIQNEKDRGLDGLINLIGIESPGLTSVPAIAEYVETLIE